MYTTQDQGCTFIFNRIQIQKEESVTTMTEKYDEMVKRQKEIKSIEPLLNTINKMHYLKTLYLAEMISVDHLKKNVRWLAWYLWKKEK